MEPRSNSNLKSFFSRFWRIPQDAEDYSMCPWPNALRIFSGVQANRKRTKNQTDNQLSGSLVSRKNPLLFMIAE